MVRYVSRKGSHTDVRNCSHSSVPVRTDVRPFVFPATVTSPVQIVLGPFRLIPFFVAAFVAAPPDPRRSRG